MRITRTCNVPFGIAILTLLAVVFVAVPAAPHGPLDQQIESVTGAIEAQPRDAQLYLRRGELYRLGRHWDAARRDYDLAAQLDPERAETALCRGALGLDTGDAAMALSALDTFLAKRPDHPEGLLLRSRALRASGQVAKAVADMDRAIAVHPNPRPEHYLERAQALAGENSARIDVAIRGLDAGIERLGPIVSLELYAIDLELAAGRYGAALARLTHVEAQAGRQPAKRAEILAAEGERGLRADASAIAQPAPTAGVPTAMLQSTAAPARQVASAPGAGRTAATLTRSPYLQRATPTSVVVRWRTAAASDSRVRYGSSPANRVFAVDDATLVTEHELTITGLAPNTRYYYSVGTSTEILAGEDYDHYFITPPVPGQPKPTRVWALGDSGSPGSGQNAVRDAYYAFGGGSVTDVWLMLGDNAYNAGTDLEYQVGLFVPYKATLRNCVLWPTRGNHDQVFAGDNNDYYDIFSLPAAAEAGGVASGTEAYYSFDHGNIHFVCLDSEGSDRAPTGAMAVWLRADLTANDSDWTIAYWHHPPYTKGSHNSDNDGDSGGRMRDMRTNFVPILDSLGVDLALTGHSHSYERSYLLDRHYGPSTSLMPSMILDAGSGNPTNGSAYAKPTLGPGAHEGAVHAVAGSSAHTGGGTLNHPAMFTSMNVLGSMVLDVEGPRLLVRFVDNNAVVRDYFAILKPGGETTGTESSVRVDLRLDSARPNPFQGQTRILYSLPSRGAVRLTVHDVAGRRIATIVNGERPPGQHDVSWNGRDERGHPVAAGVYFARLEFDGASRLGKIVLSR